MNFKCVFVVVVVFAIKAKLNISHVLSLETFICNLILEKKFFRLKKHLLWDLYSVFFAKFKINVRDFYGFLSVSKCVAIIFLKYLIFLNNNEFSCISKELRTKC